jgi:regulator of sigma E protease
MVLTIALGLIGLGLVIFVHEAGHFTAAKLSGIEVESFALGWGRRLFGFTYRSTEYRINIFPIGGYCRMKGEEDFRKAVEQKLTTFPVSEGSLFSVSPLKRLLTFIAGPASNMIFAIVLFTMIALIGYEYSSYSNKIVLATDYPQIYGTSEEPVPAQQAGLRTGDRIIAIDQREVNNFIQLQEALLPRAEVPTSVTFESDGVVRTAELVPQLNPQTGAGVIGISPWVEPVISSVGSGSVLMASDIKPGDRIISYDGTPVTHVLDLVQAIEQDSDRKSNLVLDRDGTEIEITVSLEISEQGEPIFNASFIPQRYWTPEVGLGEALLTGARDTFGQISLAVRSISLLFQGLDAQQAMAGPLKITYLLGDTASQGFSQGFRIGVVTVMQLLAFVSVALGFANLLPIPALDGGQIVVAIYEAISGKALRPVLYYRLQIIGFMILFSLLLFTLFSDVSFFLR